MATLLPKINHHLHSLTDAIKSASASSEKETEIHVSVLGSFKDLLYNASQIIRDTKDGLNQKVNIVDSLNKSIDQLTSASQSVKQILESAENSKLQKTLALDGTITAISQEMARSKEENYADDLVSSPEDLVTATKAVSSVTTKAVAAAVSQDQKNIINFASGSREALTELLKRSASAAKFANAETKGKISTCARECSQHFLAILKEVKAVTESTGSSSSSSTASAAAAGSKDQLATHSKNVAQCLTTLTKLAEELKGEDWEDPDDPTVVAERDLLVAAASIDAAAKKLALLRPRKEKRASIQVDDSLNFEEQILEAAKSIAHASSALIKAASYTQKELIERGIIDSEVSVRDHDDEEYRWSKGLVSAAQHVAAATNSLCEAANAVVLGTGSEEMLVSSAKLVASSTAQLILAAQVKAGKESENMKRLQEAGTAVRRASDNLVKAAEDHIRGDQAEEEEEMMRRGGAGGGEGGDDGEEGGKMMFKRMIEERNALIEVEKAERELKEKRDALMKKRKQLNHRKSLRKSNAQ